MNSKSLYNHSGGCSHTNKALAMGNTAWWQGFLLSCIYLSSICLLSINDLPVIFLSWTHMHRLHREVLHKIWYNSDTEMKSDRHSYSPTWDCEHIKDNTVSVVIFP
jgi:hypothetical protein